MAGSTVIMSMAGDVATIRLNDPARLNAITLEMVEELEKAIDQAALTARALILTGEGRAFCAGANLGGGLTPTDGDGRPDAGSSLETHVNPLMTKLRNLPFPWISAVRGAAAGVGCSLALAADIVITSETAYFMQAFARIGLVPDGGSTWLLARAVGRVRAMEMMLLGERISAAKALDWGLVNTVVADDQLDAEAMTLATRLAAGPTRSLGLIRKAGWAAADMGWEDTLTNERNLQREAGYTADHAEGVAAFLEKRPARFTGA